MCTCFIPGLYILYTGLHDLSHIHITEQLVLLNYVCILQRHQIINQVSQEQVFTTVSLPRLVNVFILISIMTTQLFWILFYYLRFT
jgi:hypothetical protein